MPPDTLVTAVAQQGISKAQAKWLFSVWSFPWLFHTESSQGAAGWGGPIILQLNRETSTSRGVPGFPLEGVGAGAICLRAEHPVTPTSPNFGQREQGGDGAGPPGAPAGSCPSAASNRQLVAGTLLQCHSTPLLCSTTQRRGTAFHGNQTSPPRLTLGLCTVHLWP